MDRIAKAAPIVKEHLDAKAQAEAANNQQKPEEPQVLLYEGVPLDMFHYFSIDMKSLTDVDRRQMADIYKIIGSRNMITRLRRVEQKIGQPAGGETRCGKVWHHLKLQERLKGVE